MLNNLYNFDFITSSNNTKSTLSSSVGIFINLLKTDGTCIVPNICALLFCVFISDPFIKSILVALYCIATLIYIPLIIFFNDNNLVSSL